MLSESAAQAALADDGRRFTVSTFDAVRTYPDKPQPPHVSCLAQT
jgi:hypothetical protein